jgi:hypothetical protein
MRLAKRPRHRSVCRNHELFDQVGGPVMLCRPDLVHLSIDHNWVRLDTIKFERTLPYPLRTQRYRCLILQL